MGISFIDGAAAATDAICPPSSIMLSRPAISIHPLTHPEDDYVRVVSRPPRCPWSSADTLARLVGWRISLVGVSRGLFLSQHICCVAKNSFFNVLGLKFAE